MLQIAHVTFAICIFQFAFFFDLHFSILILQFSIPLFRQISTIPAPFSQTSPPLKPIWRF